MLNVLIPAYTLSIEKLKNKHQSINISHQVSSIHCFIIYHSFRSFRKENHVNVWKHKIFDFCATQWLCQNYENCENANKSCFYSGV